MRGVLLALRGVLLALVLRAAAADEEDAALATTGCELTLHHQLDLPKAMVCAWAAFGPLPSARDGAPLACAALYPFVRDVWLADALDLIDINVPDTWDASLALTSVQGKRKRMIENNEADQDEYMVATVILSQEIKVQRQRRRIAKLESALLQLRESTVLAYERMIAEDT